MGLGPLRVRRGMPWNLELRRRILQACGVQTMEVLGLTSFNGMHLEAGFNQRGFLYPKQFTPFCAKNIAGELAGGRMQCDPGIIENRKLLRTRSWGTHCHFT